MWNIYKILNVLKDKTRGVLTILDLIVWYSEYGVML